LKRLPLARWAAGCYVHKNAAPESAPETFPKRDNPLKQSIWQRLWKHEAGFSLIEAVAATFIAGTVVVGSVVVMGTAARTAGDTGKNLDLQQFVQAQIEIVQNSPFSATGDYPTIGSLPEQVTVEIAVSDSGTNYTYPNPDGSMVINVVQKITVTACEGATEEGCPENASFAAGFVRMSVYKLEQ
jgi:hypothetical protein